jgi:fatty-acyl-CoA synthase
MAAIRADTSFNLMVLYTRIQELPKYAQPQFIRIMNQSDMTSTFKHKKFKLVNEGINIDVITDPIFMIDNDNGTYKRLTKALYDTIIRGNIRI